jgi:hypothetical protein
MKIMQILKHEKEISQVTTATCFHAGFLLGLVFNPENGGDMFI